MIRFPSFKKVHMYYLWYNTHSRFSETRAR